MIEMTMCHVPCSWQDLRKTVIFRNSIVFSQLCSYGVVIIGKQNTKMHTNNPLDEKKFADTAENEAFEGSEECPYGTLQVSIDCLLLYFCRHKLLICAATGLKGLHSIPHFESFTAQYIPVKLSKCAYSILLFSLISRASRRNT